MIAPTKMGHEIQCCGIKIISRINFVWYIYKGKSLRDGMLMNLLQG